MPAKAIIDNYLKGSVMKISLASCYFATKWRAAAAAVALRFTGRMVHILDGWSDINARVWGMIDFF